jgi:hypothetical protein
MAINRDGGKGDVQRPLGVSMEEFDSKWDAIFGAADKKKEKQLQIEIEAERGEASINVTKTWDL